MALSRQSPGRRFERVVVGILWGGADICVLAETPRCFGGRLIIARFFQVGRLRTAVSWPFVPLIHSISSHTENAVTSVPKQNMRLPALVRARAIEVPRGGRRSTRRLCSGGRPKEAGAHPVSCMLATCPQASHVGIGGSSTPSPSRGPLLAGSVPAATALPSWGFPPPSSSLCRHTLIETPTAFFGALASFSPRGDITAPLGRFHHAPLGRRHRAATAASGWPP